MTACLILEKEIKMLYEAKSIDFLGHSGVKIGHEELKKLTESVVELIFSINKNNSKTSTDIHSKTKKEATTPKKSNINEEEENSKKLFFVYAILPHFNETLKVAQEELRRIAEKNEKHIEQIAQRRQQADIAESMKKELNNLQNALKVNAEREEKLKTQLEEKLDTANKDITTLWREVVALKSIVSNQKKK